jgi:hypothetical protein
MSDLPNNHNNLRPPFKNTTRVLEQRAAIYTAYVQSPDNQEIRAAFRALHTRQHYALAGRQGAFLSYSPADDVFAIELAEHLRERHYPVWIDMLDVPQHADWNESVQAALGNAGVMLLVLSPDSVASEAIQQELAYFLRTGKLVLPILHRSCDPTPLSLMHPVIDFRQNPAKAMHKVTQVLNITDWQAHT